MSRARIAIVALAGALVAALLIPTAATGAAAILKVVVTNTSDNPVPVRGTVNVSGPLVGGDPVPVTGSVDVTDNREPFEIRVDLNLPAGQPFGNEAFEVPAGKRLVVEFVAARATVPNGQTPLLGANTQNGALGFPIPVDLQGVGNGNAFYNGSMDTLDFAGSGFYLLGLERQNPGGGPVTGSASASFYVSGYLIPTS